MYFRAPLPAPFSSLILSLQGFGFRCVHFALAARQAASAQAKCPAKGFPGSRLFRAGADARRPAAGRAAALRTAVGTPSVKPLLQRELRPGLAQLDRPEAL